MLDPDARLGGERSRAFERDLDVGPQVEHHFDAVLVDQPADVTAG